MLHKIESDKLCSMAIWLIKYYLMKQITIFLFIGIAGIFAMLLAPTLNASQANAQGGGWTTQCKTKQGTTSGPCPSQSENSPNKQQQQVNPGNQVPPGQQTPEHH